MYTISRGGYSARHPKPFLMSRPDGLDCPILLIVKSPARFRIGPKQFDVTPGCAIIIRPGTPYQYHDLGEDYKNDWLRELRLTMQSQPDRNYTPAELARSLNISPSYFQALYREFFGVPFKTDLINMRLDYAQSLITETNLTLNQIAAMSGYHNEIHFYRQFKAKTGMTPRNYQGAMNDHHYIK